MSSSSMRHPLYAAVEHLKELNEENDYWHGLESMGKLLENIKNNPLDERFRRFPVDDPFFNSRIGCMIGSEKLMLAAGFLIDEVNGKEFYYMHATAEAWEELLTVSAILQSILADRAKQRKVPERTLSSGRSVERVPSRDKTIELMAVARSNSKRSLQKNSTSSGQRGKKAPARSSGSTSDIHGEQLSKSSSSMRSSRGKSDSAANVLKSPSSIKSKVSKHGASRRGSNGESTSHNDSNTSFFADEGDHGTTSDSEFNGVTSEDNEVTKSEKKKKKKRKKKKASGTSSSHDDISKAGGKIDGENHLGDGDEPKSKKKKKKPSSEKKSSEKDLSKKSFNTGSTDSVSSQDERNHRSKGSLSASGDESGDADAVGKTATKDYWKNASTQAMIASRMQNEESSKVKKNWDKLKNATLAAAKFKQKGNSTDDENGNAEKEQGGRSKKGFVKSLSSKMLGGILSSDDDLDNSDDDMEADKSGKGGKRRSLIKIDSIEKVDDGASRSGSIRGLMEKATSMRSMDSSGHRSKSSKAQERREKRLQRRLERAESRKSLKDLERGLSLKEIEELRQMAEEKKKLREFRKKRLLDKIKKEHGPRWSVLMMSVSIITAAELGLDLGTTVISFVSLLESFSCCGNVIDAGGLTIGVTIPYFVLIVAELVLLVSGVRHARANSAWDAERMARIEDEDDDLEFFDDEESFDSDSDDDDDEEKFHCSNLISWVIICNPFLGCLISWVLLYEVSSKEEAFLILFLETGSVALMFLSLYLEREKLNFCSLVLHGLPLLPFAVTCFVVWYYLEKGGICFRDGNFWFSGCGLCDENRPAPPGDGLCPNGTLPYQGTYCGENLDEQFCYYSY